MVSPFCLEKTRITNPESLKSLRVMERGIVKPDCAANGDGEVNSDVENR